jgi:hypothetical protein
MSRATTEPALPPDALSAGDTILGHTPEQAEAYRAATASARFRQASGMAPPGSAVQAPAPSAPGLPHIGVARALLGAHLTRLCHEVALIERDLSVPPIGVSGQVVPHLLEQHRLAGESLDTLRGEIDRLSSMTDEQCRAWAANDRPGVARG